MPIDIEPIDIGDVDVLPFPRFERKRHCSPEVRAFMRNAVRELERNPLQAGMAALAGEEIKEPAIEIPVDRFSRIGLKDKNEIVTSLESCPESEYVKVEAIDDVIKLVKVKEPETRAIKHYTPRKFGQEEND